MTTTEKQQLVIIGNGMAAGRLLSEMLHLGMDEYAVSVFDQESHGSYNRIMLSPVLAGEMEISEIITHPEAWYAEHNITLHSNDPIVSVDKQAKTVTSETGKTVAYDKLVFATGSDPILPPNVRECPYTGITSFRNLKDVQAIKEQAAVSKHALVIGGGLLGLEAAYGLRKQGIEVSVVNRAPWLLNRQLDEHSGNLLQAELEGRGITIYGDTEVTGFSGNKDGHVSAAILADGTTLDVDQVIVAIGIFPNKTLANEAGFDCERGLIVNDALETSEAGVYSLGECCQFGHHTFGLVAPIWDQAKVLANQLCANGDHSFVVNPTATKLKVSGINLYSAGEYMDTEDTQAKMFFDRVEQSYKKLLFRGDQLVGAVLYGAVQDGNWYFDLINNQKNIQSMRPHMIFGREYTEMKLASNPAPTLEAVAS